MLNRDAKNSKHEHLKHCRTASLCNQDLALGTQRCQPVGKCPRVLRRWRSQGCRDCRPVAPLTGLPPPPCHRARARERPGVVQKSTPEEVVVKGTCFGEIPGPSIVPLMTGGRTSLAGGDTHRYQAAGIGSTLMPDRPIQQSPPLDWGRGGDRSAYHQ